MFVARAYDLTAEGEQFFSPRRPRLSPPETRSRVAGYLATAPQADPGYRTDGEWVWPEVFAAEMRRRGVGPEPELLDHLAARDYLLPVSPSDVAVEHQAGVRPWSRREPAPVVAEWFFAVHGDQGSGHGDQGSPATLVRVSREPDGTIREETWGPYGWRAGNQTAGGGLAVAGTGEITEVAAARLADEWCSIWHQRFLREAQETVEVGGQPRLARVFDRESPSGEHWFSPQRLRILEPERRRRLVACLVAGRLVLRATGRMVDPLDPGRGPVVPLSYRTDGTWIWSEALAYYVRERGVAPELEFLCHLEERGLRPPDRPSDETARAAATLVRPDQATRVEPVPFRYYLTDDQLLGRRPDSDAQAGQVLRGDLRWWVSADLFGDLRRAGHRFVEIDEERAAALIDQRWRQLTAPGTSGQPEGSR